MNKHPFVISGCLTNRLRINKLLLVQIDVASREMNVYIFIYDNHRDLRHGRRQRNPHQLKDDDWKSTRNFSRGIHSHLPFRFGGKVIPENIYGGL